jgi:hypothetical protein
MASIKCENCIYEIFPDGRAILVNTCEAHTDKTLTVNDSEVFFNEICCNDNQLSTKIINSQRIAAEKREDYEHAAKCRDEINRRNGANS